MSKTHLIIDEGTPKVVALAIGFVIETDETSCSSDVDQFIAKCNPEWGWDEAKKREVFAQVMAEVNPPTSEAPKAPKKSATANGSTGSPDLGANP